MPIPKTLLAIALLACGATASAADKVYIANENADTVSVLDAASFKVLAPVRVGKMPHNVQVAPDGKVAWVTNNGEPDADAAPGHPDMNKAAHAVMAKPGAVWLIDTATDAVIAKIPVADPVASYASKLVLATITARPSRTPKSNGVSTARPPLRTLSKSWPPTWRRGMPGRI